MEPIPGNDEYIFDVPDPVPPCPRCEAVRRSVELHDAVHDIIWESLPNTEVARIWTLCLPAVADISETLMQAISDSFIGEDHCYCKQHERD